MKKELNKLQLIKVLNENILQQKNVGAINKTLVKIAKRVNDNTTYNAEFETKFYNRGVLAEMLVRTLIIDLCSSQEINTKRVEKKHDSKISDLDTTTLNKDLLKEYNIPYDKHLEIKMSYASGYASCIKDINVENIILLTTKGLSLIKRKDLIVDKYNKIPPQQPNAKPLTKINEILGL